MSDERAPSTRAGRPSREWLWPAALVLTAAVIAGCFSPTWFIDLRVYALGGAHALDAHLYDQQLASAKLPYTYPPFAALVMLPIAHLPFALTAAITSALGALALMLVARVFLPQARPGRLAASGAAAIALEPVWATVSFGQINLLLLALVVFDLLALPTSHRARGALTGLAAGLKLTPLIFVAYLVATRQYRDAAAATATFALTVALGFCLNPHGARAFWGDAVLDSSRVGATEYAGNQSLTGVLARATGGTMSHATVLVITGAVALLGLWVSRRAHDAGCRAVGVVTVGLTMVSVSPIAWSHHWVWAFPAALCLANWTRLAWQARARTDGDTRPPALDRWMPLVALVAWCALFASHAVWFLPRKDGAEFHWNVWQQLVGGLYVLAAAAWIIGVAAITRSGRSLPCRSSRRP